MFPYPVQRLFLRRRRQIVGDAVDHVSILLHRKLGVLVGIAFLFSALIELLQVLLRLGTFQLSDIVYNTVGGIIGGVLYYIAIKIRKKTEKSQ